MKKQLLFLFLVFFLFACTKKEEPLTIEEDKMILILVDVYLAEGALQPVTMALKDSLAATYYEQIYKIHDIKEEDFLENVRILRDNPNLSKAVYKKVLSKHGEVLEANKKK